MNIETKYFGNMKVDEEKIIQFEKGLPGFREEKAFVLIDFPDNPVFQILQSTNTSHVAFVVANPYHFYQDFAFEIDNQSKDNLSITKKEQVMVLSILTLRDPFVGSTINLQAPLIINVDSLRGQQLILTEGDAFRAPLQSEKARVK
ncbi:flagellar assembly protein FliW [Terribacillus halophilus]|uniref:flagellar assembly protein FliW n=1 Tax=Terribacillus halophilus TaxID=361279 RepID=UPI0009859965|nr:flagellar assembly protein FliW [Terribacillus halophilus]